MLLQGRCLHAPHANLIRQHSAVSSTAPACPPVIMRCHQACILLLPACPCTVRGTGTIHLCSKIHLHSDLVQFTCVVRIKFLLRVSVRVCAVEERTTTNCRRGDSGTPYIILACLPSARMSGDQDKPLTVTLPPKDLRIIIGILTCASLSASTSRNNNRRTERHLPAAIWRFASRPPLLPETSDDGQSW